MCTGTLNLYCSGNILINLIGLVVAVLEQAVIIFAVAYVFILSVLLLESARAFERQFHEQESDVQMVITHSLTFISIYRLSEVKIVIDSLFRFCLHASYSSNCLHPLSVVQQQLPLSCHLEFFCITHTDFKVSSALDGRKFFWSHISLSHIL